MKKMIYNSPLGNILIEMEGQSLTKLYFSDETNVEIVTSQDKDFQKVTQWLDKYFSGKNPDEILKISPKGSVFQLSVWETLNKIGFGQTISYAGLAKMVEKSFGMAHISPRAIGKAVASNKIAIIIPCHRVVGSDGKLKGYAWGLNRKKNLLDFEKK